MFKRVSLLAGIPTLALAVTLMLPSTSAAQQRGAYSGTYGSPYAQSGYGYYGWGSNPYSSYYYGNGSNGFFASGTERMDGLQNSALVIVRVAADAEVWFGNSDTVQKGTSRPFISPPLSPEKSYTYDIRVQWMEKGERVERTRRVSVSAGKRVDVDFTTAAAAANANETPQLPSDPVRYPATPATAPVPTYRTTPAAAPLAPAPAIVVTPPTTVIVPVLVPVVPGSTVPTDASAQPNSGKGTPGTTRGSPGSIDGPPNPPPAPKGTPGTTQGSPGSIGGPPSLPPGLTPVPGTNNTPGSRP